MRSENTFVVSLLLVVAVVLGVEFTPVKDIVPGLAGLEQGERQLLYFLAIGTVFAVSAVWFAICLVASFRRSLLFWFSVPLVSSLFYFFPEQGGLITFGTVGAAAAILFRKPSAAEATSH